MPIMCHPCSVNIGVAVMAEFARMRIIHARRLRKFGLLAFDRAFIRISGVGHPDSPRNSRCRRGATMSPMGMGDCQDVFASDRRPSVQSGNHHQEHPRVR